MKRTVVTLGVMVLSFLSAYSYVYEVDWIAEVPGDYTVVHRTDQGDKRMIVTEHGGSYLVEVYNMELGDTLSVSKDTSLLSPLIKVCNGGLATESVTFKFHACDDDGYYFVTLAPGECAEDATCHIATRVS